MACIRTNVHSYGMEHKNNDDITSISLSFSLIIVKSCIELVESLLQVPNVNLFLGGLCQDPLEKFFGQQCQHGWVNENLMLETL